MKEGFRGVTYDVVFEEVDVGNHIEKSGGSHPISKCIKMSWS